MSHGCGTLASPGGFAKGNAGASSATGQHTLPSNAAHKPLELHDHVASQPLKSGLYDREGHRKIVQAHWEAKQTKTPTRMWGTTRTTKWQGEERTDNEQWHKGEFWNVDSNIRIWGLHEVRRNAAQMSHDIHRHDQKTRFVLQDHPGEDRQEREERQSTSGMATADAGFLEAWGFDLGQRDRRGNPMPLWRPGGSSQMFTMKDECAESFRPLRKQRSAPGTLSTSGTIENKSEPGEAPPSEIPPDRQIASQARNARICYHDSFGHAVKRESAKLSCGLHGPSFRSHADGLPVKDNVELSPASIYNRKYRKFGEEAARKHVTSSQACGRTTARSSASRITTVNRTR